MPTTLGDLSIKPTLTGDRVLLRPFTAADVPVMAEILADPDVIRLTGSAHSTAEVEAQATPAVDDKLSDWYLSRVDQVDRLDLAVVDRSTDACVGEVVLNDVDTDNLSCNFRTLIGAGGRDRGLGTEAARLIIGYGFETLGFHRISLSVFGFNPRARRAYEKVGFRSEGVLRQSFRFDGEWYDDELMAILRPEFEPGTP
jgi:RimJ/RimL family protein N-acetyltransferase